MPSLLGFLSLGFCHCSVMAEWAFLSDYTWPCLLGMTRAHPQLPELLSFHSPPSTEHGKLSAKGQPDGVGQGGSQAASLSYNPKHDRKAHGHNSASGF